MPESPSTVGVVGHPTPSSAHILTPEALAFVADLHRTFNPTRLRLLERRTARQAEFDAGAVPDFLAETAEIRQAEWQVASAPPDL